MADYNIYIHAPFGGSGEFSQTKPWKSEEGGGSGLTTPFTGESNQAVKSAFGALSKFSNPDSLIGMGVSAISKAVPWIACAMIVLSITDKVITTSLDFATVESGDYSVQIGLANFKQNVSNLIRPFSSSLNYFKNEQQIRIQNQRRTMQRELLGDSIINSYTNRGV